MKWYWKLLIVLFVLIITGYFSVDYFATSIIKAKAELLKEQVKDDYKFNYKSLDLSLIERSIVLKEFEFYTIVDSSYNENKYDFKIDKLSLKYATYFDLFLKKSVDIIDVHLKEPEIRYGLRDHKNNTSNNDQVENGDSLGASFFKMVTLENFQIESGKVDFYNLKSPDKKIVFVNDLDVDIQGFVIDLEKDSIYITESSEKPLFSFKEIYKNDLEKHNLNIDEIQYFFRTKELVVKNFVFENKESPAVYRKSLKYRSPWFSITVPEIQIKIDPRKIYDHGIFHIPKIEITEVSAIIDNDLNFPIKPGKKPMPGSSIKALKQNLLIDSIQISNSSLKYIHKAEAAETGYLKFSKLDALALRVTDIDSLIAINPFMDLKVKATFWDEGSLNVNYRFDLSSQVDRIDVSGSLKNMSLKKAENMVKPLYGIEVQSGQIDELVFDFSMDDNIGKGTMKFDYSELKLDVKKEEKQEKNDSLNIEYTNQSSGVLNFAANQAIRTSNMPGEGSYQATGNIIIDRTKNKPVFDLLWNCIANGMMDIAIKDAFFDSQKNYEKAFKKYQKQQKKEAKKAEKEESNKDKFTEKGGFFKKKKKE